MSLQLRLYALVNHTLFRRFPRVYHALYSVYKAVGDRAERRVLKQHARKGMTVLDVGANIGIYSRYLLSLVAPGGIVIAFEPDPLNFSILQSRCAGLKDIVLHQAAVAESNGTLTLYLSPDINVDHRSYPVDGRWEKVTVPSVALDDVVPSGTSVGLIKMDIQGFECHALKGMERILAENGEIALLSEYYPEGLSKAGTSGSELLAFLRERGFGIYEISHGGTLRPVPESGPALNNLGYTNIFAKREA